MERSPWEHIFAERLPLPEALQFLVAKESGDIILREQPYLQREKFGGGRGYLKAVGSYGTLLPISYGTYPSLKLFVDVSNPLRAPYLDRHRHLSARLSRAQREEATCPHLRSDAWLSQDQSQAS